MTNSIFNEQVPAVSNQDKESINNQYYTNDVFLKTKSNALNKPMNYQAQPKIRRSTTAYNNYRTAKAGRASVSQNSMEYDKMVNPSIYNDEYTNAVPQHNYSLNVRLANSSSSL